MKAYIFFSVHEELFHRVAERLREHGVDELSGFAWSPYQLRKISGRGIDYDSSLVFTRDMLPACDDGKPADLAWLQKRERELGVSIQRMLASERHLLAGRNFDQLMRLAEVALREIGAAFDRVQPDFIFSEDVSCFHSYAHWVLARERGIPFWCIGTGRLPNRLSVYSQRPQRYENVDALYREIVSRGLTADERKEAEDYVVSFRARPQRPTGMGTRAKNPGFERSDARRFKNEVALYLSDRDNPVATPPLQAIGQRFRRIARVQLADLAGVFEPPEPGEQYVLYPIHYQPEASTLVQAPMYLDQVQLLHDIAKSLPIGYRLYVKEHVSNRGRRPLEFYQAIREIPAVRLLGPDADTWSLIQNAAAIAVITGTMGWEGLLFGKPVISFGDVYYNVLPHVYRASEVPKDGWYELFARATSQHRDDHDALLALVSALHQRTWPGFMKNPNTFPEVLADENVANITHALVDAMGLLTSQLRRPPRSEGAAPRT
ncbi:MAG TPA: hypothetical protein VFV99_01760 [Kofleriaceae bacterium]|nr:hypothetical protein [Kofleriaceae bacterium]